MLSKTAVHALTAVAKLAEIPGEQYAGAVDVARHIGAPENYLGKLLKTLGDIGVLESQKGRGGGFRLARDPATISLLDVVEPIDRVSRWSGCFLGWDRCSDETPCPVHERWKHVRETYVNFLRKTTIADLVATKTRPSALQAVESDKLMGLNLF